MTSGLFQMSDDKCAKSSPLTHKLCTYFIFSGSLVMNKMKTFKTKACLLRMLVNDHRVICESLRILPVSITFINRSKY